MPSTCPVSRTRRTHDRPPITSNSRLWPPRGSNAFIVHGRRPTWRRSRALPPRPGPLFGARHYRTMYTRTCTLRVNAKVRSHCARSAAIITIVILYARALCRCDSETGTYIIIAVGERIGVRDPFRVHTAI